MTKAAIIHMVKFLAVELKEKDIRINSIAPGLINTDMSEFYMKRIKDTRLIGTID